MAPNKKFPQRNLEVNELEILAAVTLIVVQWNEYIELVHRQPRGPHATSVFSALDLAKCDENAETYAA